MLIKLPMEQGIIDYSMCLYVFVGDSDVHIRPRLSCSRTHTNSDLKFQMDLILCDYFDIVFSTKLNINLSKEAKLISFMFAMANPVFHQD
jgi:hypothetical protein